MRTALNWQKSSFCAEGNNCLEVTAPSPHLAGPHLAIRLRESAAPGVVLTTTPARLAALLRVAKAGAWGSGADA
ncbi:DUF397 domain-containing protein [Streptomyces iconiensis]|uniref:DUF397 domain-containing protein n=1 Tax=Streptomyces iconiensis TaxID=1384038 RepID=A0ABT7A0I3_9ACTN|nr:DUF397 domain-containing protein [Streptomyces iconiensis]MDJ1134843.1 DUF397 domain-containing protein [Streptomyces iconiensis]